MTIKDLLDPLGIEWRKTKLGGKPPQTTYIAAFESNEAVGPDLAPGMLIRRSITLELYAYKIDEASENLLESALCANGFAWTKTDREWIEQEKLYQTVYNFYLIEKGVK